MYTKRKDTKSSIGKIYISTSVFFIIANSAQQITIHINVLLIAQILII